MASAIRFVLLVLVCTGTLPATGASGQTADWPWLGVIISDIATENLEGLGGRRGGTYVTSVEYAGPASSAGVLRHDIIVAIDGRHAGNTRELTCLLQVRRPGDVVVVTVMRGGQPRLLPATLGSWPATKEFPRPRLSECSHDRVSMR